MKRLIAVAALMITPYAFASNRFDLPVTINFDTSTIVSKVNSLRMYFSYQCGSNSGDTSQNIIQNPQFNMSCKGGAVTSYQLMGMLNGGLTLQSNPNNILPDYIATQPHGPLCSLDSLGANGTYNVQFNLEPFYNAENTTELWGYYLHCDIRQE